MPISPLNGAAGATGATGATGASGGKAAGGRLTLESGVPVSITDQTAKTTLYYAIFKSAEISLYYSAAWTVRTFAELSVAIAATASKMFDAFVYWDGSACQLELLAWTNDTTRATALVRQDGVWVKSGATDRRYVGSIRTTTAAGQSEDSEANRLIWNLENQVPRSLKRETSTVSWTYSSTTKRQWNASTAEQFSFICGLAGPSIQVNGTNYFGGSGSSVSGIGLNSTTVYSGKMATVSNNAFGACPAFGAVLIPALGYNFVAGIEHTTDSVLVTYNGYNASQNYRAGFHASWDS